MVNITMRGGMIILDSLKKKKKYVAHRIFSLFFLVNRRVMKNISLNRRFSAKINGSDSAQYSVHSITMNHTRGKVVKS